MVDVRRALALPIVAKELGPTLDALEAKRGDKRDLGPILSEAGLAPRTDVKDIALCLAKLDREGAPRFAIAIGGDLRRESVVAAFERIDDPKPVVTFFEDRKVASTRDDRGEEVVLGQAADGAVVLANDRTWFEAATKTGATASADYRIPATTEAGAVVAKPLVASALGARGAGPLAQAFAPVTHVALALSLATPSGEIRMATPQAADAKRLASVLTTLLLPTLKRELGDGHDEVGETTALANAKARADGTDCIVDLPWSEDGLARLTRRLALLAGPPPPK